MPYVARDETGRITGVSERPSGSASEFLPADSPEVQDYLRSAGPMAVRQRLTGSDLEMARITEDLIDVLIGRNVINFTDLPIEAQKKLVARQKLRKNLSVLSNLVSDEDSII
ncbi:MAG: tryptophan synthase subunit beta like protein [Alphaproteobacteria bacterium]|nr:tryptophan synthase subunit beta like protein [Alphaproteobacteria bacterium]